MQSELLANQRCVTYVYQTIAIYAMFSFERRHLEYEQIAFIAEHMTVDQLAKHYTIVLHKPLKP